ncbi:MAG: lysostaphin resistance A-like protein [Limisphaerales bacterium]
MLPDKIWSLDTVGRLFGSLLAGSLLGQVVQLWARYQPGPTTLEPAWFYLETGTAFAALVGALVILLQRWPEGRLRARFFSLLVCFYAALALTGLAQRGLGPTPPPSVSAMVINALFFQGATLPLVWFFVRQEGGRLREAFGLNRRAGHALGIGLTVAFACVPLGIGFNFALSAIARQFGWELPQQTAVLIVRLAESWPHRLALAGVTVVLAPLAEEMLFRGIAYPTLRRFTTPGIALWGSSLVFALIHFNKLTFLPLLLLSVVLTLLYRRTGNLLAPIACHAAFNACNFALLFFSELPPPDQVP